MKSREPIDTLKFPSNRTVKRCKEDAKAIRKGSKGTSNYISYNQALNIVAAQNGINLPWDRAIQVLMTRNKPDSELFNWLKGKMLNQQAQFKKDTHSIFEVDGQIMLPDGEGRRRLVVQHKARNNGLVMTPEVIALVEKDIESLGGLDNLRKFEGQTVQIIYEKVGSLCHLAYEFHFSEDGVITYFCRSQPWNYYEAELHARGYSITSAGCAERFIDTALHWSGFEMFHSVLTPKVL